MSSTRLGQDAAPKIYFAAVVAGLVLSIIVAFTEGDTRIFLSYALPQVCYVAAAIGYLKITKTPFLQAIPFRKPIKTGAILLSLAITVGIFCHNLILAVGFQWLIQAIGIEAAVVLPDFSKTPTLILGIIIVCVMPAIGEETMFRGVALSSLKQRGAMSAILLSAAMFSLSHGNPAQLVHQFLLGVALAYMTLQTGNIIYAMIVHFFNNLLAITLPLMLPAYNTLAVCNTQNALIMLGLAAIGGAILYPSLYLMTKKYGKGRGIGELCVKKPEETCYNNLDKNGIATADKASPVEKAWLVGLFIFLIVQLLINTVISAVPSIRALVP